MNSWIAWTLSFALATTSAPIKTVAPLDTGKAPAPLTTTQYLAQTLGKKSTTNAGQVAALLLAQWPKERRGDWQPYLDQIQKEKAPKIDALENRILINTAQGSLVLDFHDPEMKSVQVNGQRIWIQDLLQVHSGLRQMESLMMKPKSAGLFPRLIFGDQAHAEISVLATLVIGGLLAFSYPLAKLFGVVGKPSAELAEDSSDPPSPRLADVPGRSRSPVRPAGGRPHGLGIADNASPAAALQNVGSSNRCERYPAIVAAKIMNNNNCDISWAIQHYRLTPNESRQVFCGDQAWLPRVGQGQRDREQQIQAKVSEIERRFQEGLVQTMRAEGLTDRRTKDLYGQNFRVCVQRALRNEILGCNPNQPIEAISSMREGLFKLTACPGARISSDVPAQYQSGENTGNVNYGGMLRLLGGSRDGQNYAMDPCAVADPVRASCANVGQTQPRSSAPAATAPAGARQ